MFLPSPSARHFHVGLILSCAWPLLQSLSSHCRPDAIDRAPSLGFRPSSRHRLAESTRHGHPRPTPFRPRRFSRPRRFPPPRDFAGLFHPATTSRVPLFRGFPWREAVRARRPPLPSCRCRLPPALQFPDELQVHATAFRALLRSPIRRSTQRFRPRPARSPPELSLPRVLLRTPSERPSPLLPTTAFHGPRRVADARPDLLLRACLPRPRFPACHSAPACAVASSRGRVHQAIRFDRPTTLRLIVFASPVPTWPLL